MDVHTFDVDGDTEVKQVYDNKSKSDDGVELELRAIAAGAKWTASWEYYSTHTHADWTSRGASWPPKAGTVYSTPYNGPSGTTTSSTSTTTTTPIVTPPPLPTPTPSLHVCDIQGCTLQTPYDRSDAAAALHEYCSACYQYKCDGRDHSQTYCYATNSNGGCTVGNYYMCESHSHVYPTNTPDCSYCTDGCNLCAIEAPPIDGYDPDCQSCGSANFYTCVKCGERFDICYSHIGNCSVEMPEGDNWHTSYVWW